MKKIRVSERAAHFRAKYEIRDNGCWEWTHCVTTEGYGQYWDGKRQVLAHRWSYEQAIGPIPAGKQLHHSCRMRRCVNPRHVTPLTPREHLLKGGTIIAAQVAKTHCSRGHPFDEANTHYRKAPPRRVWRSCRICSRANGRAWYGRHGDLVNQQRRAARARRNGKKEEAKTT